MCVIKIFNVTTHFLRQCTHFYVVCSPCSPFFLGQLHKWRTLQTFKLSLASISTKVHPFLRRLVRHYVLVLEKNGEHGERGEQNDFDKHIVRKKRN